MNPKHYHTPISVGPQRRRCPVCHQTVYSRAGIHPQCAMKQSEPPHQGGKKPSPAPADVPIAIATTGTDVAEVLIPG